MICAISTFLIGASAVWAIAKLWPNRRTDRLPTTGRQLRKAYRRNRSDLRKALGK